MPHVPGSSGSGGGGGGNGNGNSSSSGGGGPVVPAVAVGGAGSSGSGGSTSSRMRDDPNDCDEIKVFKCEEDEGEGSSDDVMNDDKRDLIRATECEKGRLSPLSPEGSFSTCSKSDGGGGNMRPDHGSIFGPGKLEGMGVPYPSAINPMLLGYTSYPNGSPLSMAEKLRMGGFLGFPCNGVEGLTQPPPAHMGYPGLGRPYPFGIQYPYPGLPEVSQVSPWPQGMYTTSGPGSGGYRSYPPSLPTSLPSDFYSRFSPLLPGPGGLGGHHPSLGHHLVGGGGPSKHESHSMADNHRDQKGDKQNSESGQSSNSQNEKKKPHIKKPLNAFMLYMKEMRAKVVAECTLKESAAINQILGRRWHGLNREEQSKYYEMARQERQLHMQLYPGWSARDNYGYGAKKKKRKKEKTSDGGREEQAKYYELARRERQLHMQMYPNWSSAQNRTHHEKKKKKKQDNKFDGGNSMKKCRARYGLDQQSQWCKPCRRKKKCIRYMEEANGGGGSNGTDDNLGSAGSAGEPNSPDSKAGDSDMDTSSNMGDMSSPNFSLTSPGMSMTSPGMSLPSPALTSPPGASLASPAVSLPSLQSPLTPSLPEDRLSLSLPPPPSTTTSSSSTPSSSHSHSHSHHNRHSPSSSTFNMKGSPSFPPPGTSPNFGFGLGHLFNGSGSPGMNMNMNMNMNGFPYPFPLGLNLFQKPHRGPPVGTNPHDVNNPLSVNQLTGQCNSASSASSASSLSSSTSSPSSKRRERQDESGSSTKGKTSPPVPAPVIGVS